VTLLLAVRLTALATALALLVQTAELLVLRRQIMAIWRPEILAADLPHLAAPVRLAVAAVLPASGFTALLGLRLAGGLAALVVAALDLSVPSPLWLALLVSQLLVAARFRGTFNGGSDAMTVVLLIGCTVAALPHRLAPLAGLGWIAAQATLSYVVAGLVKLREPGWRSGAALRAFVRIGRYGVPSAVVRLLDRPGVAPLAAWAVITWECLFFLAFVVDGAALPLVAIALSFHLANAYLFGLNRFLHAWAASYPAILAIAAHLR
jgi:hypothetical protein